jgi:hypothetical protein
MTRGVKLVKCINNDNGRWSKKIRIGRIYKVIGHRSYSIDNTDILNTGTSYCVIDEEKIDRWYYTARFIDYNKLRVQDSPGG